MSYDWWETQKPEGSWGSRTRVPGGTHQHISTTTRCAICLGQLDLRPNGMRESTKQSDMGSQPLSSPKSGPYFAQMMLPFTMTTSTKPEEMLTAYSLGAGWFGVSSCLKNRNCQSSRSPSSTNPSKGEDTLIGDVGPKWSQSLRSKKKYGTGTLVYVTGLRDK